MFDHSVCCVVGWNCCLVLVYWLLLFAVLVGCGGGWCACLGCCFGRVDDLLLWVLNCKLVLYCWRWSFVFMHVGWLVTRGAHFVLVGFGLGVGEFGVFAVLIVVFGICLIASFDFDCVVYGSCCLTF